jgi:TolB-like protein/class 3 adenylate cyclase/Tfp pilus assembly protein PilF
MERKLAAILAVDVVGYSAHMEADEAGTFDRLTSGRKELFEPEIGKRHGRIFKLMGDGLLAEFGSVVDAVECAAALQRGMAERNDRISEDKRLEIRIGINLGEVIVEGDDRLGDGVNVAARLQQLADPGGICVSEKVSREVEKKLAFGFEPMGEQRVKNIAEPISCFRVIPQLVRLPQVGRSPQRPLELPMKAAIAVLPFTNMSSDPEQEYFAEGLAEDLITDLSKVPGLLVIARNSSFAYKGKPVDVRSIAKDLGVRYIVEGSVRRAASRVRINAQLIDAGDNAHVWADRFDGDLADVFTLQDEVVGKIVGALSGVLPAARPLPKRRTTDLAAYELFVRARPLVTRSPEDNRTAQPMLEQAVEIDPGFAEAHAWLAMSYHFGWLHWGQEPHHETALAAALHSVALDPQNADGHMTLGYLRAYEPNLAEGLAEFETALRLNPSHAYAWAFLADLKVLEGKPDEAIDCARNAFRLNPYPPSQYYWLLGWAQYAARRYEDAVATLRHKSANQTGPQRIMAASLAQLGRSEEAKEEGRQFLAANPHFSVQQWAATQPFRHEADRQHFVEGYLKAGLPP